MPLPATLALPCRRARDPKHSGPPLAELAGQMPALTTPDATSPTGRATPPATPLASAPPIRLAIVAPTLAIMGGHSGRAAHMLRGWRDDPAVDAWLVPIDPTPPGILKAGLRISGVRTAVKQATYWPLLARELRKADVVHVFSASYLSFLLSPLPAVLTARALGKPVVLNYHSGEAPDHLRRSAVARRVLAGVERLAVPSAFLRDVFPDFGLSARVVPNVIDLARFPFRERTRPAPRLLSTSNLEGLYNVACTLRAFRFVQDRYPDATLTVVGSGSQAGDLHRLAAELGLRGVTFTGRVDPGEIPRYCAEADIYVQTPDIDNMPLSVLEAFAAGLPVVSTAVGGGPTILEHETHGLLAPAGDCGGIAGCVVRLIEQPGLAAGLARAARETCDAYTWPAVRDAWLALYREALDAGPAARRAGVRG
jgi:L-malate glycosyltransferase